MYGLALKNCSSVSEVNNELELTDPHCIGRHTESYPANSINAVN